MYVYNESILNLVKGVFCILNGGSDGVYFFDRQLKVFGGAMRRSIRSLDDGKITITGVKKTCDSTSWPPSSHR